MAILTTMAELVTLAEAAEIKGVSRQAIHAAVEAGKLRTVQGRISVPMIRRDELARYQPNPNMKRAGRPRKDAK